MSYLCKHCGKNYEGSQLNVVTQVREVHYNQFVPRLNRETRKKEPFFTGTTNGIEIAEEKMVCRDCHDAICTIEPELKGQKEVDYMYVKKMPKLDKKLKQPKEDNRRRDDNDKPDFEDKTSSIEEM